MDCVWGSVRSLYAAVSRKKALHYDAVHTSNLERRLRLVNLIVIGVAATLSVSIYVLLGQAARNNAGPGVVLSLIIDGLAALMSGLCYAELAARMPVAGSAYTYTSATMGEALAFLVGWNLVFEYAIGTALFARGFTGYFNSILHGQLGAFLNSVNVEVRFLTFETRLDVAAALLCILLTVIIVCGWEPTNAIITVSVAGSAAIIVVIVLLGLVYGSLSNWDPFLPYSTLGVIKGASTCFYAFVGYDVIAMSAEETVRPRINIPYAIIITIGISFFFFILVAAALTLLVPYRLLTVDATLVTAFQRHGFYFFGYLIFIGMALGAIGGITATLIPLPRLVYAMSKDGLLFSSFGNVNSRNVPMFASIVTGVFTAVVAMCFDTGNLVRMTSMGTLVAYSSVSLCVILLRYRVIFVHVTLPEDDGFDPVESSTQETEDLVKDDTNNEITKQDICVDPVERTGDGAGEEAKVRESETADPVKAPQKDSALDQDAGISGSHLHRIKRMFTDTGCPTEKSELVVSMGCFCLVVQLTAICCIVIYAFRQLFQYHVPTIISLAALAISTVINLLLISVQPQNKAKLTFGVPLVPWLPALSLFINIYLIMLLDRGSWIRFGIWLFLGLIVYFGFGIHHSRAEESKYTRLNESQ